MYYDQISGLEELKKSIAGRWSSLQIEKTNEEIAQKKREQEDPALWNDTARASKLAQDITRLERRVRPWADLRQSVDDTLDLARLASSEEDASLQSEILALQASLKAKYESLDIEDLFKGEFDGANTYLVIHAGAGGTEACDWVSMLMRMYLRWTERAGFETQILDTVDGDEAGIKSVTLSVRGLYAYGYLKAETGIHRLVRKSPFDSANRRHTSFASVYATPEITDDVEVDINPADLRIDTYRASGAGGQHVNKTSSAVRITHLPSGTVVACQNERSQHQNKEQAMKILKSRLYERMKAERQADIDSKTQEKTDIAWGNQIRSYVFEPYTLIKDHRTNHETGNVRAIMDGELDEFIFAWLRVQGSRKEE
jgi:peptide chain release factor 2